jgi:hypothetical protein
MPDVAGFWEPPNTDQYAWSPQRGAVRYQGARATTPDFNTGCTTFTMLGTIRVDTQQPALGTVFYYLRRVLEPNPGSWGADSAGVERLVPCAP